MTPEPAALRFENVFVAFEGEEVLHSVSFAVPAGETRILFGAAGSGKTVALKTALGLVTPDSGRVYVFGQDISRLPERELFDVRSKIGMLFQESALFDSLTIEENVAYPLLNQKSIRCGPEECRRRVREALRFVELEHTLEKFPSELSGGMRRRVAIARAVVTGPPLLLYDSPTAGLDPITANTIITLIVKQRDLSNTTTLIVTHRYQNGNLLANYRYEPQTGRLLRTNGAGRRTAATRFLGFKDGRLILDATQDELDASTDPYVSKFVKHNG
ncbi:MAG: ATP-binding cassette domain-containing protein [Acidobacteria bacterium]|nr:ATP-binding cassette domain-containing protein [Acidobacteriota bacterium]MBI3472647.1 ATP-binding cassette domain-containing protein [Candidatus Solibacter usitatus]